MSEPKQIDFNNLPPTGATLKVPGIEVSVNKDDTWQTVGMVLVLVLVVYAGIKLINKLFDKWK